MLPLKSSPGHLAENVMHFGRVLRAAGLPLGSDRIQTSLAALKVAGLESRRDFRAVLAACMVDRREHAALFDQAFDLFWRDPDLEGRMRAMLLPKVQLNLAPPGIQENRRLGDALFPEPPRRAEEPEPPEQIEVDATLTWSDRELLRKADFETMSADEWREARRMLAELDLLFEPLKSRRTQAARRGGSADFRATLREAARHGGEIRDLSRREPRVQPAPLIVLADISGSMSKYSRMLLHFAHALGRADARVESFVFGTRLTRTTRLLASRDPDLAVTQVVRAVDDWSGGTRISACLHEFNRRWARRVLPGRSTLLLISDGLEQGDLSALAFEAGRLKRSCRRLIWLNPLLRFEGFEPRAGGIRAILPQVDLFLPAHNIESLAQLARILTTERRAAPAFLGPHGGRAGRSAALGASFSHDRAGMTASRT